MNIKTINQSGIKNLLAERVKNPELYVNKPLVIWRADIADGIQERILDSVFNEHNEGKKDVDHSWYRIAWVHQLPYTKSDILFTMIGSHIVDRNNNEVGNTVTVYNGMDDEEDDCELGLLVINPKLVALDYGRNPELLNKYHSLINDRKWDNIEVCKGVPVVAYMCLNYDWFETPEAYPDAEQYIFVPDFEEWAEWAKDKGAMPDYMIDFIRGDGDKAGIAYRWYNHFNHNSRMLVGCEYPASWLLGRAKFRHYINRVGAESLNDARLKKELLNKAFSGEIAPDVVEELWEYMSQHEID